MNDPYLESSEQINRFFPGSLHKIKFHIFKNKYNFLINVLRPFRYKNKCELCDNILDKDKRRRIMLKKCFVLHKEVIDVFHEKMYIPTI